MDDPSVQGEELQRTLDEIAKLNRRLGAYPPSVEGLRKLAEHKRNPGPLRVLDVGCGSGDIPRVMVDWARAQGLEIEIEGIELAETSSGYARSLSVDYPEISFRVQDLFTQEEPYDVVHASQVLHHFPGEEAQRALHKMRALAKVGVVVSDLHRHPVAWWGIRAITKVFTKNPMVQYDGPLSVRRAFTISEFEGMATQLGAKRAEVLWRPLFRLLMILQLN